MITLLEYRIMAKELEQARIAVFVASELLAVGKKILAIKMLRYMYGESLPSAKQFVDTVQAIMEESEIRTLAETERLAISKALYINKGNRERTARQLGIGERTLYRKLKGKNHEA